MKVAYDLSKTGRTAKIGNGDDPEFPENLSLSLGTQLYIPCGDGVVLTPTKIVVSGESSINAEYREWKKTQGVFDDCPLKSLCGEAASRSLFPGYFCVDCICNNYRDNKRELLYIKKLADKKYQTNTMIIQAVREGEIKKIERKSAKPVLKSVNIPAGINNDFNEVKPVKSVLKSVKRPVEKINKGKGGGVMGAELNTYYYEKQTVVVNLGKKETTVIISLLGVGNLNNGTEESTRQRLDWYDNEAKKESCGLFKVCGMIVESLELPRYWCCCSCPFQDFIPEKQAGIGEKMKKLFSDRGKIEEAQEEGVIVVSPHDLNGRIIWSMPEDIDEQKNNVNSDQLIYRIVKNGQMDLNKHRAEQALEVYDNLIIKGAKDVRIFRKINDKFVSVDIEDLRKELGQAAETQEPASVDQKKHYIELSLAGNKTKQPDAEPLKKANSGADAIYAGDKKKSWNRNPLHKLVYPDGQLIEDLGRLNSKYAIKMAQKKAIELGQLDSTVQVFLVKTMKDGTEFKQGPFTLLEPINEIDCSKSYVSALAKKGIISKKPGQRTFRLTVNGLATTYVDRKKKDLLFDACALMAEGKVVTLEWYKKGEYIDIPILCSKKTKRKSVIMKKSEDVISAEIVDTKNVDYDKQVVHAKPATLAELGYSPEESGVMHVRNVFAEAALGIDKAKDMKAWKNQRPKLNGSDDYCLCVEQDGLGAGFLGLRKVSEIITIIEAYDRLNISKVLWYLPVTLDQIVEQTNAKGRRYSESINKALSEFVNK